MRYADGGGLTAERRAAREGIRLEAGLRFARGDRTSDIAKDLRVSERSVEQWRRNWREGGMEGLKSKGRRSLTRPRHPSRQLQSSPGDAATGAGPAESGVVRATAMEDGHVPPLQRVALRGVEERVVVGDTQA